MLDQAARRGLYKAKIPVRRKILAMLAQQGGGDKPEPAYDGKGRIWVELGADTLSPRLGFRGSNWKVDWGDGTEEETVASSEVYDGPTHTYAKAGEYVITVTPPEGGMLSTYGVISTATRTYLFQDAAGTNNAAYQACVRRVRFGAGFALGSSDTSSYTFSGLTGMTKAEVLGGRAVLTRMFDICYALTEVVLMPDTEVGTSGLNLTFNGCRLLETVKLGQVSKVGSSPFSGPLLRTIDMTAMESVPPATKANFLSGVGSNTELGHPELLVKASLLEDFKTAANWSTYADWFVGV